MGESTVASGINSFASGAYSVASATNSTAMGYMTTANGLNSSAFGSNASANNFANTFVYGDGSATTLNDDANEFTARASGGFEFYDNNGASPDATLSNGVLYAANVSVGGSIMAASNATTASADAGVTVTDVPVFIITAGSTSGNFALTLPSGSAAGDMIVIINQDPLHSATYGSTGIVTPLGSRTFYFDGSNWQ
jgi:hypothetical protein